MALDHILTREKHVSWVKDCVAVRGPDISSDNKALVAHVKQRLRTVSMVIIDPKPRWDMLRNEDVKKAFLNIFDEELVGEDYSSVYEAIRSASERELPKRERRSQHRLLWREEKVMAARAAVGMAPVKAHRTNTRANMENSAIAAQTLADVYTECDEVYYSAKITEVETIRQSGILQQGCMGPGQ